ncbi:MAG: hypothetical protein KOO62_05320 [candidate division Zixibacteria bacterium]|nr:hypothetical protein [candidate division Zixibacteria bacterium]
MSDLKFTVSTDTKHEIELDSTLESAMWCRGTAVVGQPVKFEVITSFVGNGAKIKITGMTNNGTKLGKISDKISNNVFVGEFDVPENIELDDEAYFEVKLPENDLSGESNKIPCVAPAVISNMRWSASEARRGDVLTLSADVKNVHSQTEVLITIYEYDEDGAHDKVTDFPGIVRSSRVEVKWEYEYFEDVNEVPTEEELQRYGRSYNPPRYFFTIKVNDIEYGREQESGLLAFKDWIEIKVLNYTGNENYVLHLADGSERRGSFGEDGTAREEDVPPGRCSIEIEREN